MTTKKKTTPTLPRCPLCKSQLILINLESGNRLETGRDLKTGKNQVLGVVVGIPRMQAKCAQGCAITVRAARKPGVTGKLIKPPRRGPTPVKNRAKSSGALLVGGK